jgi:hypothetical protein
MKAKPTISIPSPCSQSWHSMSPNENGKFCNSCQKNIVDFTILSNTQILDLLASSTSICGRISQTQMDKINSTTAYRSAFSWRKFSVAAALVSLASSFKAEAKAPVVKSLTEQGTVFHSTPLSANADTSITYKKIYGKITEEGDTTGIPGVTIFIKGTNVHTVTNVEGKYSLNVPVLETTILVASYIGYNTIETKLEISKPAQQYNLVLKMSATMLGEIVAIKRPSLAKRIYYRVTKPFRLLFRKKGSRQNASK